MMRKTFPLQLTVDHWSMDNAILRVKKNVLRKALANSLPVFLHPDPRMSRWKNWQKRQKSGGIRNGSEELHGDTVSTGVISAFGCVFDRDFFHKGIEYLSIPCCFLSLACWWAIMVGRYICCTRLRDDVGPWWEIRNLLPPKKEYDKTTHLMKNPP